MHTQAFGAWRSFAYHYLSNLADSGVLVHRVLAEMQGAVQMLYSTEAIMRQDLNHLTQVRVYACVIMCVDGCSCVRVCARTHFMCVHVHTHTHARTHTRAHARAHTHTGPERSTAPRRGEAPPGQAIHRQRHE